jgi:hypothetical protein
MAPKFRTAKIQWVSDNRTSPVFKWSILPRTGHLITGLFKNQTNLSAFWMIIQLDHFTRIKRHKIISFCVKLSRLARKSCPVRCLNG